MKKYEIYKYLPLLSMLYVTCMLAVTVLSNKIVVVFGHITMAGTLFIPLFFSLSDVIAEIYGYKIAKNVIYTGFICHLVFSIFCYLALKVPHPDFWQGQEHYQAVLGNQFRLLLSGFLSYMTSSILNIYLVSKWKVMLNGRYFWLRSLGASTIGELLYTAMAVILIQYRVLEFSKIGAIIITSYTIKIIGSLILAFPSNIGTMVLKKVEIVPENDNCTNPFLGAK